jgi:uncharacterized protein (DUF2249 family)
MPAPAPNALDLRPLPSARKRAALIATFDRLPVGDAFILVNDDNPRDLCTCLDAERPNQSEWTYLRDGPYVWHVHITRQSSADG